MYPSSGQLDAAVLPLRRPLIGVVLSAVAGCGLGYRLDSSVILPLALAVAGLSAAFLARRRLGGALFVHAAVLGLFWLQAVQSHRATAGADAWFSGRVDRVFVSVIGLVDDEAGLLRENDNGERTWSFPLRVEGTRRVGEWKRTVFDLRVLWTSEGAGAPVEFGQRWLLHGLVQRDTTARGRSPFELRVAPEGARLLGAGHGSRLRAFCFRGRQACAEILGHGLEDFPDEVGLLRALMLGYRQAMPDHLYDIFSRTGTLHIVAISGSHEVAFNLQLLDCCLYPLAALTVYEKESMARVPADCIQRQESSRLCSG